MPTWNSDPISNTTQKRNSTRVGTNVSDHKKSILKVRTSLTLMFSFILNTKYSDLGMMLEIYFILDGYNKNEVVKNTESLNFISIEKKMNRLATVM